MTMRDISECIGVDELAQLVLDELPLAREAAVLGHLATCDLCAELSRHLHELSSALDSMPAAGALARVARAVRSVLGWSPGWSAAAEALGALALGGIVASPDPSSGQVAFTDLAAAVAGGVPPVLDSLVARGAIRVRGAAPGPQPPLVRGRFRVRARAGEPAAVELHDSPGHLEVTTTSWPADTPPPPLAVVPAAGEPFEAPWTRAGGQWRAGIDKPADGFAVVFCAPAMPPAPGGP
jgi:hypothetical protein